LRARHERGNAGHDAIGLLSPDRSAGAGLGLALALPVSAETLRSVGTSFQPNIWVRIAPDETITVVLNKSEMGQGVINGLPTILVDELDASMSRVRTEFAGPNHAYDVPGFNEMVTGESTAIRDFWMPLRRAGASARAMLVGAAAQRWGVAPSECSTSQGVIFHTSSGRSVSYGRVASAAATMPVPKDVPLKSPDRFTLIGKKHPRPDIPGKVNGTARYGIDVRVPAMVYASIARSPVFGGSVRSFDARKAKAVPGVIDVVQISNGVAVVGTDTWAAFQGKAALDIVWNPGRNANVSTEGLFAEAEHLALTRANERVAVNRGNAEPNTGKVLSATYRGPFLAHATMEPMNTTADVRADRCEVWSPTQVQTRALAMAVKGSGLQRNQCTVHTTLLGGGFGRRLEADYVLEAVEVSKAIKRPVKVTWTREDDIQGDFYRAMSVNTVRGVVADGQLTALSHQVVSPSWLRRWAPPVFAKDGIDSLDLAEVADAPYTIPNLRVSYIDHEHGIPVGSWRAPNANWNGFVTESFIDELAHAAGKDPLEFRLSLLTKNPRAAAVLRFAAEKAGWDRERAGFAQGIAITHWVGSLAAVVVDVSMEGKMPKVHRVVGAVDCGTVVNPDIIVQQGQGATNFGLSAALTGKITIKNGRVEQNNFYDYTVLRMAAAPSIEIHIIPSSEPPTGIGEVFTPPIAPAVSNAIFRLTGKRVRALPFSDALA
jgi:isoquinoline 1-oxidoreductase beta subunit